MSVIAEFVFQLHDDGTVTAVGYRSEVAQHEQAVSNVQAAMPGSQVVEDPWANMPAAQPPQQAPGQWQPPAQQWGQQQPPTQQYAQPAQTATPACAHGPLKAVPGGIAGPNSRNPGKPYAAFWACQAPQGQTKCRLDQKQLPPVPA